MTWEANAVQSFRLLPLRAFAIAAVATAFLALSGRPASAEEPAKDAPAVGKHAGLDPYKKYCASCHSIGGGKLVGPDLKGLKERVPSKDWAIAFVRDPKSANDPYGAKVRAEFNDTMTAQGKPQGPLDDAAIGDIIDFIFQGGPGLAQKALRKATVADIAVGRDIFVGRQRLANGGPSCISCHSIAGIGGLGGGTLASTVGAKNPDLTNAFNRNGGEAGLRAAMAAPQFLVMQQVFADKALTDEEIVAVTAFLADASRKTEPDRRGDYLVILGIVGAIALLMLFDFLWIKRFRNVRKTLVGETS
jgi:mono/diheme cytochrome c family protein